MTARTIILGIASALVLAACSGASEKDVMSNDALSNGGGGSTGGGGSGGGTGGGCACAATECGPIPEIATPLCSDGSSPPPPQCERNDKGTCGWVFGTCPVPPPPPVLDAGAPVCDPSSCGPAPALAMQCPGGTTETPVCELNAKTNSCGWTFPPCPIEADAGPATCGPTSCGPNPYGMPNYYCKDGSLGGPVCDTTASGTCGWQIRSCP